jgi:hypothetical protein
MPGDIEWKYVDGNPLQADPMGHESCVLSMVAGKEYVVAKLASVVMLKMLATSTGPATIGQLPTLTSPF